MRTDRAALCVEKWRETHGMEATDLLMNKLTLHDGRSFRPVILQVWATNVTGDAEGVASDSVPIEFLFPDKPPHDTERFREKFGELLEEFLREEQQQEFRARLAQKQKATNLRRRKGAAQAEDGDSVEESWREYLRKPAEDTRLKIHAVEEIVSYRHMLSCKTSMSVTAAEALGKAAFPLYGDDGSDTNTHDMFGMGLRVLFAITLLLLVLFFFFWAQFFFNRYFKD
uniref:Uncharacterized protein n=1 Tax=Noctiluca scintillans TaxID=2966 RepID=A0A7S1AL72_NOCSC